MSSLPDQNPLSAESLWQALGALRAAVHRAAETDLAVLLAVESGQAAGEAQGDCPDFRAAMRSIAPKMGLSPLVDAGRQRIAGPDACRGDCPFSGRIHWRYHRKVGRQHEPCGRPVGAESLESLSQDAAIGHGRCGGD